MGVRGKSALSVADVQDTRGDEDKCSLAEFMGQ